MQPGDRDPVINLGHADADLVEFGGPPRPRRPRLRWAIAAVVVLVVAGALALDWHRSRPRAEPSHSPSPSAAAPTTTTSPVSMAPTVTELGHPLLGVTTGWELFGRADVHVVRIELAAGRVTHTPMPGLNSSGPVSFLATAAGAVVRPLDAVPGYAVPDDQPARPLTGQLAGSGPALPGPTASSMWVVSGNADDLRAQLVDEAGRPMGDPVTVPPGLNGYLRPDGSGYLVLLGTGGVYALRPGSIHRISTGTLLAAGPTRLLTLDCDDQARCAVWVTEKATGARYRLPRQPLEQIGEPGVISPDGRTAAIVSVDSGDTPVVLVDLSTGDVRSTAIRPSDQSIDGGAMVWSPDSRWLLVADFSGTVRVVDRATGDPQPLAVELPQVYQLAIRPAP